VARVSRRWIADSKRRCHHCSTVWNQPFNTYPSSRLKIQETLDYPEVNRFCGLAVALSPPSSMTTTSCEEFACTFVNRAWFAVILTAAC
jgi:hypothetical protein